MVRLLDRLELSYGQRLVVGGLVLTLAGCGVEDSAGGDTDTDTDGASMTSSGETSSDEDDSDPSMSESGVDDDDDQASTSNESASTSGPSTSGPDPSTSTTDDTATETGSTQTCNKPAPGIGYQTGFGVDADGRSRSYDLFIPTNYSGTEDVALVVNFHGLTGNPQQQANLSGFNDVAEERGMVVAYPAGIDNSFNSGLCCGGAYSQGVNDVAFARALVDQVATLLCIDRARVYVMGMSNGGHMAHLLACQAADVFAASASVTGVLNLAPFDCTPSRPISMMDFHGTSDSIVPYGGTGLGFPAVPQMMSDWAGRNNCGDVPNVSFEQGDMRCETWPACEDDVEVTLCTVTGGGHCWPGSGPCILGQNSSARSASEAIADMFESQSM